MKNINRSNLSRRRFVAAAGLGAAAAVFAPRLLIAQESGIVPTMRQHEPRLKFTGFVATSLLSRAQVGILQFSPVRAASS
jgi:hypothetical protein